VGRGFRFLFDFAVDRVRIGFLEEESSLEMRLRRVSVYSIVSSQPHEVMRAPPARKKASGRTRPDMAAIRKALFRRVKTRNPLVHERGGLTLRVESVYNIRGDREP
jgi:hypothetical protein